MNLNNILIGTEDPKRLKDYYTKIFGKPAMEDEAFSGWQLGTGWISVGGHDQVKGKNAHPGRLIWNLECADVKADFAKLKAAGAIIVKEPYNPGGPPEFLIATLADPDDN